MILDELFVGGGQVPGSRIHVVGNRRAPADTAVAASGANHLAQVIVLQGSLPRRLWLALTLRVRVAFAAAQLGRFGAAEIRAFAAVPSLESPTFLYELGTSAATYASHNLHMGHRAETAFIRAILGVCMGCDPATGAVIVIGRRT